MKTKVFNFHNKFGPTHKSAGIEEYVDYALKEGANTISVISSGNLYMALKQEIESRAENVQLVNLINTNYKEGETSIPMEAHRILRDGKEREEYINKVSTGLGLTLGKVIDVTDFMPNQYMIQAKEILSDNPDYVAVPVGSGKLFLSIYRTIKQEGKNTKIIGLLPKGENGLDLDNQIEEDEKLYFKRFEPKSPADKLVSPYILNKYRKELMQAKKEGHQLVELNIDEVQRAKIIANKYVKDSEYSSAVGFITTKKSFRKKHKIPYDASVTVINTGKGTGEEDVVNIPIWSKISYQAKRTTLGLVTAGIIFSSGLRICNHESIQQSVNSMQGNAYCHLVYANWLSGISNDNADNVYEISSKKELNKLINQSRETSVKIISEKLDESVNLESMAVIDQEAYISDYKILLGNRTRKVR